MNRQVERRGEVKERRRGKILDAADLLYAKTGWDALTVDRVARDARVSRALVYVYFGDKKDLLFAIGERAMKRLRDRFATAIECPSTGLEKIEAIAQAHMAFARECPHYFDFCARLQSHLSSIDAGIHEQACLVAQDQVIETLVQAIDTGISDGSIAEVNERSYLLAVSLWVFTHVTIQLTIAKGREMTSFGIAAADFSEHTLILLRKIAATRKR